MLSLHFASFDCVTTCPSYPSRGALGSTRLADLLQDLGTGTLDRVVCTKNGGWGQGIVCISLQLVISQNTSSHYRLAR